MKISIVTPAYNAARTIEGLFLRVPSQIDAMVSRYIVVDDGSHDETGDKLQRLAREDERFDLLEHRCNRGYGAAMKTLLTRARATDAELIVVLHADGQYAPEELPRLIEPLVQGNADLVQGSRMMGGALRGRMPLYKYLANRALTVVENAAFGMQLAEFHSGFMLYHRSVLEQIPFERFSETFTFDQEMLITAHVAGLKLAQLPIPTHYGDEVSHLRPIPYGLATLGLIGAYYRGWFHQLSEAAEASAAAAARAA